MIQRIKKFLEESREEWHHVNWPPRNEALYLTGVVVGFSVLIAVILGAFDALLYSLLQMFIIGG